MDSERRHELETNDLREFLDNFKDFWDKHGNKILIVLIVVLGGYAGINYYSTWKTGQAEEAYNQLAGATTVDQLLAVAGEHERVHDEAMRRAGDLALGAGRTALIDADEAAAKKALKQAGSAFTALADRGATIDYQLVGHEGLAKTAVMAGDWEQAKSHYDQIIKLAGDSHPLQAARAQAGLKRPDQLKQPIPFAPDDDLSFDPDAGTSDAGEDIGDQPAVPVVPDIDLPAFDPANP